MLLLLLSTFVAHAECDLATLRDAIESAETAFAEMEPETFSESVTKADDAIDCMSESLSPVDAAGYHRLKALAAFFDNDKSSTVLFFQAVQGTQPGYKLSETIAPAGHPLRQSFDEAKQFSGSDTFDLSEPERGWLNVDGRRSMAAPSGRPYTFQWLDDDGAVQITQYQMVNAPLPTYPEKPEPKPEPVFVEPEKTGPNVGLLIGGGALLVGGGAAYGAAFATRGAYNDAVAAGDKDKINANHSTTNALTIAGAAGAALGAAGIGISFAIK